ncbi:MAG: RNA polymerase sigma factor [Bacteroidales bacterium]|nr:RNA polymerase sigma factor [Bacteroidales bacterium]
MTVTENISDSELIKLFEDTSKRETVFRIIMKRYGAKLYSHVRTFFTSHEEADDIVQNTFVKAWSAMPKFRAESSLYTWLYRIATNEALTFVRNKKNRNTVSLDGEENFYQIPFEDNSPHHSGEYIASRLKSAVEQLPEKQRIVFNMKYFEEMRYEDMSEILGTSVGALKASYHFAVKKIESYLERD